MGAKNLLHKIHICTIAFLSDPVKTVNPALSHPDRKSFPLTEAKNCNFYCNRFLSFIQLPLCEELIRIPEIFIKFILITGNLPSLHLLPAITCVILASFPPVSGISGRSC